MRDKIFFHYFNVLCSQTNSPTQQSLVLILFKVWLWASHPVPTYLKFKDKTLAFILLCSTGFNGELRPTRDWQYRVISERYSLLWFCSGQGSGHRSSLQEVMIAYVVDSTEAPPNQGWEYAPHPDALRPRSNVCYQTYSWNWSCTRQFCPQGILIPSWALNLGLSAC